MLRKSVNMHEAKTHLSQLVQFVAKGNEVEICNAGTPLVKLTPLNPEKLTKRQAGTLRGQMIIPEDFDEIPESFMKYFKEDK